MKVLIGVDPHKGSHTAVAIDRDELPLGTYKVRATRKQCEQLLAWADGFPERRWAIESAGGLGSLLAQQLIAAGEDVVDVPPTLSARVRVLGSGRSQKNDPNDALSTAVAALRNGRLHTVVADDHVVILRMLADRHHNLTRLRTQAVCRLHAMLANLVLGGISGALRASRASTMLASVRPVDGVVAERKHQARELLADVRRLDADIKATRVRIVVAVAASKTSLTHIYGVGPIVAALVLGHAGDVRRFASRHQFASYNGSAPIEASSGPKKRHRLNPRGNRQLNHALHIAAICQIRYDTPGRAYYLRKIEEGKTKKEALRALKRRLSDAVYRQLLVDASRAGM
jgi:transposase